jgi:hypothetical protein
MKPIIIALMLASGCLKAIGPDVGGEPAGSGVPAGSGDPGCQGASCPDAAVCVGAACVDAAPISGCNTDSDPTHVVSFTAEIYGGLFVRNKCTACHTGGGEGIQDSGLNLATYATLRAGGGRSGTSVIIPGMPCASIIYQKVGAAPPFGSRMPKDNPRLTQADMNLLSDWILEGANDN